MRLVEDLVTVSAADFPHGTAIAIGKFDGVHLGHRELLTRISRAAAERGLAELVFTFANNPLSFLRPELCPAAIMSKQQRIDALADAGVPYCVMLPFDAEMANTQAEDFVRELLHKKLQVKYLCVGTDFRFGNRGAGDPELLKRMGEELGFTVEVIADVESGAGRVSSSRVREALAAGDVASAATMLGRAHSIRGVVVHGDARGRELGFPTANIGTDCEGLRPADGVYAGWAIVAGKRYAAAISVGANVTFDPAGEARVEAYLLDFDSDIYGEQIEIIFAQRLRGMAAFDSVDALLTQMRQDVRDTRAALDTIQ